MILKRGDLGVGFVDLGLSLVHLGLGGLLFGEGGEVVVRGHVELDLHGVERFQHGSSFCTLFGRGRTSVCGFMIH